MLASQPARSLLLNLPRLLFAPTSLKNSLEQKQTLLCLWDEQKCKKPTENDLNTKTPKLQVILQLRVLILTSLLWQPKSKWKLYSISCKASADTRLFNSWTAPFLRDTGRSCTFSVVLPDSLWPTKEPSMDIPTWRSSCTAVVTDSVAHGKPRPPGPHRPFLSQCVITLFFFSQIIFYFLILLKVLESMNLHFKGGKWVKVNLMSRLNGQWFNSKQNVTKLIFLFSLENRDIRKHMRLKNQMFLKVNKWSQKIMRENRNTNS